MSQSRKPQNRPTARPSVRKSAAPSNRGGKTSSGIPTVNSVGIGGGTPRAAAPTARPKTGEKKESPTVASVPTRNGEILITRRHLLYGVAGLAAVGAAAGIGSAVSSMQAEKEATVTYLEVPESSVTTLSDFAEADYATLFSQTGSYELPMGTLVWSNDDSIGACLFPTETASPLTTAGVIDLTSGETTTLLEAARDMADGYEIYDVRASTKGLVWTEANILENRWNVYAATLSGVSAGKPVLGTVRLLDKGEQDWETPTLAAVGDSAFWQVMPTTSVVSASTTATLPHGALKRATFAGGDVEVLYDAAGRMATPLYAASKGVVITPHAPSTTTYYQLTYITENDGEVADSLTLPSGMTPLEAAWGTSGFSFCFESIYSYGDGIANLGTYTPIRAHDTFSYDGITWFRFARTPSAAPCWCGKYFIIKSTQSLCAVDMDSRTYCVFDVDSGCTTWGDYLVSSGSGSTVAGIMTIDQTTSQGTTEKLNRLRTWAPLA